MFIAFKTIVGIIIIFLQQLVFMPIQNFLIDTLGGGL